MTGTPPPVPAGTPLSRTSRATAATPPAYLDGDGDGYSSATDALLVINQLNAQPGSPVAADVPTLSVADVIKSEPPPFEQSTIVFNIVATNPTDESITYSYQTVPGTAFDGSDYFGSIGTIIVPANTVEQAVFPVVIPMVGDTELAEGNEKFTLEIRTADNQVVAEPVGTIQEFAPQITITPLSQNEGDEFSTTPFVFNITVNNPSDVPMRFRFDTMDGTAEQSDQDYDSFFDIREFGPGSNQATVTVNVIGDNFYEDNEDFTLRATLSSDLDFPIGDPIAISLGTIFDDDRAKLEGIGIGDDGSDEGNQGDFTELEFEVQLPFNVGGSKVPLKLLFRTSQRITSAFVHYQAAAAGAV